MAAFAVLHPADLLHKRKAALGWTAHVKAQDAFTSPPHPPARSTTTSSPQAVPTSLFSRDWSSSDTFRKTSSSVVSISPKLVRSSSSRLCSKCCGRENEEGRRLQHRHHNSHDCKCQVGSLPHTSCCWHIQEMPFDRAGTDPVPCPAPHTRAHVHVFPMSHRVLCPPCSSHP